MSQLQLMAPIPVTDASLAAHSVDEDDYGVWSGIFVYDDGDRAILTTGYHRIYESVADGNSGNNPATTTGYWIDIGPTNRWAMFDQAGGTRTVDASPVAVEIDLGADEIVDTLVLLDVVGGTALVELLDDSDVVLWSTEMELQTFGDSPPDWYQYFFSELAQLDSALATDIPWQLDPASLRVTVADLAGGDVEIGTMAFGQAQDLGIPEWGLRLGLISYSTKNTDEYGATTVVARGYSRTMECDIFFLHTALRRVYKLLAAIRDTPVVWIGSDDPLLDLTIIYGFLGEFEVVLRNSRGSWCNLRVEGLV